LPGKVPAKITGDRHAGEGARIFDFKIIPTSCRVVKVK